MILDLEPDDELQEDNPDQSDLIEEAEARNKLVHRMFGSIDPNVRRTSLFLASTDSRFILQLIRSNTNSKINAMNSHFLIYQF